jgi:hypothetical protein
MAVLDFCIIAPTPLEAVGEDACGVNNGKLITDPVHCTLPCIVWARTPIMT